MGESDIDVMKKKRISIVEDIGNDDEDEGEEGSDDDNDTGSIVDSDEPVLPEDEEIGEFEEENYSVKKRKTQSILPVDKSFSPSLFLSLIHCNMTFEDLKGIELLIKLIYYISLYSMALYFFVGDIVLCFICKTNSVVNAITFSDLIFCTIHNSAEYSSQPIMFFMSTPR